MLTAGVAATAVVATLVVAMLIGRARSARADRRFEAVLGQLDDHMSAISQSLERVVERSASVRDSGVDDLELTMDFDDLLRRLAAEAAARTEAPAAAVRVQGPAGEPRAASFGAEDGTELFQAPLGAAARPFRAVTINWAYGPTATRSTDSFTSALVVPIVEDGAETGTLTAYARASDSFGPDHVRALEALAEEAAPALAGARRYAEAERALTDTATGIRNRAGYESELDRAVTRAHATGLPLSLLVLSAVGPTERREDAGIDELAAVLLRVTRATDIVCRREAGELGIVLPETTGDAARRLYVRLREEAAQAASAHSGELRFAAGLVEWRPNEPSGAFDSRASAAVGHSRVDDLELVRAHAVSPESPASTQGQSVDVRLAREIARARRLTRPLTLLVIDVDVHAAGERLGKPGAERALGDVEARVATTLSNGDSTCRMEGELAVILPGSGVAHAEAVFAQLQASLASEPPGDLDRIAVSAGITEVAPGDDPPDVLDRAEHAVSQARHAGSGTVVIALPNDDSRR